MTEWIEERSFREWNLPPVTDYVLVGPPQGAYEAIPKTVFEQHAEKLTENGYRALGNINGIHMFDFRQPERWTSDSWTNFAFRPAGTLATLVGSGEEETPLELVLQEVLTRSLKSKVKAIPHYDYVAALESFPEIAERLAGYEQFTGDIYHARITIEGRRGSFSELYMVDKKDGALYAERGMLFDAQGNDLHEKRRPYHGFFDPKRGVWGRKLTVKKVADEGEITLTRCELAGNVGVSLADTCDLKIMLEEKAP